MGISLYAYVLGSSLLATATVSATYYQQHQFYLTTIQLVTSKFSVLVLCNLALVIAILFGKLVNKIFLGSLHEIEIEHLNDRMPQTVLETLLIMTIFRDEFSTNFFISFGALLMVKIFHWLSQDRVDYIEQVPNVRISTCLRLFSLMILLFLVDCSYLFWFAIHTYHYGPTTMILFGMEYTLLLFTIVCTIVKYFINLISLRRQHHGLDGNGEWENKPIYVLWTEFVYDFLRLLAYVAFFLTILTYFGLPLHIIRQMCQTYRSFHRKIYNMIEYRRATQELNQRFPDATTAELDGQICIICRDQMNSAKKLPCGHICHFHCLRNWFKEQRVCPMCMRSVFHTPVPTTPTHVNPNANILPMGPLQYPERQNMFAGQPLQRQQSQASTSQVNSNSSNNAGGSNSSSSNNNNILTESTATNASSGSSSGASTNNAGNLNIESDMSSKDNMTEQLIWQIQQQLQRVQEEVGVMQQQLELLVQIQTANRTAQATTNTEDSAETVRRQRLLHFS